MNWEVEWGIQPPEKRSRRTAWCHKNRRRRRSHPRRRSTRPFWRDVEPWTPFIHGGNGNARGSKLRYSRNSAPNFPTRTWRFDKKTCNWKLFYSVCNHEGHNKKPPPTIRRCRRIINRNRHSFNNNNNNFRSSSNHSHKYSHRCCYSSPFKALPVATRPCSHFRATMQVVIIWCRKMSSNLQNTYMNRYDSKWPCCSSSNQWRNSNNNPTTTTAFIILILITPVTTLYIRIPTTPRKVIQQPPTLPMPSPLRSFNNMPWRQQ